MPRQPSSRLGKLLNNWSLPYSFEWVGNNPSLKDTWKGAAAKNTWSIVEQSIQFRLDTLKMFHALVLNNNTLIFACDHQLTLNVVERWGRSMNRIKPLISVCKYSWNGKVKCAIHIIIYETRCEQAQPRVCLFFYILFKWTYSIIFSQSILISNDIIIVFIILVM